MTNLFSSTYITKVSKGDLSNIIYDYKIKLVHYRKSQFKNVEPISYNVQEMVILKDDIPGIIEELKKLNDR